MAELGLDNQKNTESQAGYSKLDELIEAHSNAIDKKLENVTPEKFDRMVQEIFTLVRLMLHRSGQYEKHDMHKVEAMINVEAKKIKDSHTNWSYLVVTVVAGALQIGAGAAAFSQFAGVAASTADTLYKGLSSTGTGMGTLSSIFQARDRGDQTVYQIRLDLTKAQREDRAQTHSKHQGAHQEMKRTIATQVQGAHSTAMRIISGQAA